VNYHPALSASPFVDALTLLTDARRELLAAQGELQRSRVRGSRWVKAATRRFYEALDRVWAAQNTVAS
jgi:hypothetical protein